VDNCIDREVVRQRGRKSACRDLCGGLREDYVNQRGCPVVRVQAGGGCNGRVEVVFREEVSESVVWGESDEVDVDVPLNGNDGCWCCREDGVDGCL
jgi:hypothetical protein